MKDTKNVVVIAGSPKPPGKAASDMLARLSADAIRGDNLDVQIVNVRETFNKKKTDEAFAAMAAADAMIVIFPLYVFCLPGITMRFLQSYGEYAAALPARKQAAVYAVVNCGFPEPEINSEAVRVVGRFANAVGARFRYGVMIGSGGMVMLDVQPSRKLRQNYTAAMKQIQAEMISGRFQPAEDVCLRVAFPRKLYFFMGNMGWRKRIKQNGKSKQDLCARPYQPAENA